MAHHAGEFFESAPSKTGACVLMSSKEPLRTEGLANLGAATTLQHHYDRRALTHRRSTLSESAIDNLPNMKVRYEALDEDGMSALAEKVSCFDDGMLFPRLAFTTTTAPPPTPFQDRHGSRRVH